MHDIDHGQQRCVGLGGDFDFPLSAVWTLQRKAITRAVNRVSLANRRIGGDYGSTGLDCLMGGKRWISSTAPTPTLSAISRKNLSVVSIIWARDCVWLSLVLRKDEVCA